MSDLARGLGGRATTRYTATDNDATDDEWGSPAAGRHAFNEDAVLTPIFHALTRGGWRSRQHEPAAPRSNRLPVHEPDPVDEFRRDPLTAPIPIQAFVPSPTPAVAEPADRAEQGRHHYRREPVGSGR